MKPTVLGKGMGEFVVFDKETMRRAGNVGFGARTHARDAETPRRGKGVSGARGRRRLMETPRGKLSSFREMALRLASRCRLPARARALRFHECFQR